MTKKERQGLEILSAVSNHGIISVNAMRPEVKAALDWIQRQIALDAKAKKRQEKRGCYCCGVKTVGKWCHICKKECALVGRCQVNRGPNCPFIQKILKKRVG